ncbi:MAG: aminotransferase class V-fold PLP-dependent enzyme [Hyphomonadaceae bacterium]|nr:aminotransferase class V-fold PLP-dependent enzyme [Hyphomonadaceae bacterium]
MDKTALETLYANIAHYAAQRRAEDGERIHRPIASYPEQVERFRLPVQDEGVPADQVMRELIDHAEPGLAAITGPRFHGWVMGGSNPVGVAADWLTGLWGQNAGNHLATPSAAAAEEQAANALLELFDLPRECSVGFTTGATMANFTCLAAARNEVLRKAGWDVEADGLFGAPEITVLLGEEAHSTVFAALKYLGLGQSRVVRVAVDHNGAILPEAFKMTLGGASGPIIAIVQAGQINTGAFDPFEPIIAAAHAKGAWVHVDGAFGLWARATPDRAHLAKGIDEADSWAVDGHKWLQTPYDCGYAIVRHVEAHQRAMQISASYLPGAGDGGRNPSDYTPELSRRARGFATWAMIRHLGRRRIAEMISRHCALARRFADKLGAEPGVEIMNDVVLNQVVVRFGDDDRTRKTIARIQSDGVCFTGGAQWRGAWVMRISVIGEATTEADVDRSVEAMIAAWRAVRG